MTDEMLCQELNDENLEQVSGGYYEITGEMDPYECKCKEARAGIRCGLCENIMRWYWENNKDHPVWDCRLHREPFRA